MQVVDANGNVFGAGLEVTGSDGKPKVPVINTDITIGTTAIVGGVVGQVLFQGTGNVVQESSSFTYDDTLKKFTLTGPIGSVIQHTALTNYNGLSGFQLNVADGTERAFFKLNPSTGEIRIGGTGSGYFPTFYAQGVEAMRIFASTRNVGINTTTDAGYKADINGTLRVQSSLVIANPAFTNGGTIAHTANSTLYITGGPGAGGENITFGPSNRIFINAQQTRFPNGSVQMSSTLTVGSGNATSTNMLLMQGSITASSSIARGISLETTLAQSAANDVLTAVNIAPTFTVNNTLFHDVYWARITGSYAPAAFSANNNATTIDLNNSFTNTNNAIGIRIRHTYNNVQNGYGILIESASFIGIAQTSTTSRNFFAGTTVVGSSLQPAAGYTFNVTNGTNGAIKIGGVTQASQHLVISHSESGATFSSIRNTYAVAGSQMLIDVAGQGNLRLFGTGNVGVKTTVDAGFTFDVNGTARVLGRLTLGDAGTAGQLYSNPSVGMNFSSGQVTDVFTFTQMNNGIFSTAGAVEQSMLRLGIGQATSAGGNSLGSVIRMIGNVTNSSLTSVYNNIQTNTVINTSGGTTTYRGFYHNPTLTATVGVTHFAFHSTSGRIRFQGLPTSPAGLSAGEVWNNLGILTIV